MTESTDLPTIPASNSDVDTPTLFATPEYHFVDLDQILAQTDKLQPPPQEVIDWFNSPTEAVDGDGGSLNDWTISDMNYFMDLPALGTMH